MASRLGFILLSAGCAIGLGNVWRFPYITGQYGGAVFVLIYLLCLVLIGLPVMVMEFSIGRASRRNVAEALRILEPEGTRWHLYGPVAIAGNYLLMMFYTVITGWLFYYFISAIAGSFDSLDAAGAFVGPFLATLLLLLWTEDLRLIFWVALIPGAACLMLIILGVENQESRAKSAHKITWSDVLKVFTPSFKQLILLGTLFSLARFSNAFIVLRAADVGIGNTWIPMVIVLMNAVFSFFIYPFGKLADRLNPLSLLALGLVFLIASDIVFYVTTNALTVILAVSLFGLHLGATQGVFSSIVSSHAQAELRATAFGVFNFFSGLAILVSSITAGALWDFFGASYCFAGGALLALMTLISIRSFKLL